MIIVRPARGSGKTYLMRQRIKEAVGNGETVLLAAKSGIMVIDKNGVRKAPSGQWRVPENIQRLRELIALDYTFSEELANDIWKKAMEEINSCRKSVSLCCCLSSRRIWRLLTVWKRRNAAMVALGPVEHFKIWR